MGRPRGPLALAGLAFLATFALSLDPPPSRVRRPEVVDGAADPVDPSAGSCQPHAHEDPALIDDALEIAVVPSFTRIGYAVRRHLFGWTPPPAGSLRGRTVLITGPTSGLGRARHGCAALGARLILVGRSEERLTSLRDELVPRTARTASTVVADMESLGSVRAAAESHRSKPSHGSTS